MQVKSHETMLRLKLEPFAVHLRGVIEELQEHDEKGIFAHPVLPNEVTAL